MVKTESNKLGTEEVRICEGVYGHDQKYGQMLFNVAFKTAFRK